ncbi:MAG: DUF2141 domain-containing protein [Pseudomonadota bacterium]
MIRTGLNSILTLSVIGALCLTPIAAADSDETVSAAAALDLRPGDEADMCDPATPQIRATVNNVTAEGILLVEVYSDDASNFLEKEARLRRARVAAEDGTQVVCLNIDGPGRYAVASYHDIDGDRKLDKKWNRLPKEPFALSTNPRLKLRKPRFEEAAFDAGETGADIVLNLRD